MPKNGKQEQAQHCATNCVYGHCRLLAEPWFTRVLSLERRRSERSRKPFILVLLSMERLAHENGSYERLIGSVLRAAISFTRETDITGWYQDGAVVGTIFTELGEPKAIDAVVESLLRKVQAALQEHLGEEASQRIVVSWHVFPEEWTSKRPSGRVDSDLYPDLRKKARSTWLHGAGKRLIDIVGSCVALLLFGPVLLLIALAIKLTSKGPVLFRQERIGQFGKRFVFFKFRSMHVTNDATIHQQYVKKLIAGTLGDSTNGVFKIQSDPRVTPVGRFLRKTSLDEFPQFWNVLRGDMSLVGPRPPLAYEVEVYDFWHRRRVREVKPGITGLWQIKGRSRTSFDDMVRLDLEYARSSSLWLDMQILLKTPGAVIAGDGAY